jgi:cytochrome o ubiquinol oxidase subunit 2
MSKKSVGWGVALLAAIVVAVALFLNGKTVAIFDPAGVIASKERGLILFTLLLSVIVVVPVFIMTFTFAWKYRASNTKATYTPDWDHHAGYEFVWWALPCAIILVLGIVAWQSSHSLDPYRALSSSRKPLTIQVVALDWKWLFIYPEQNIASVNYVQFPANTPVTFNITSDAPMNSFWIPQLGGQIYAMSGMSTQLHLMADRTGNFRGESANISGKGFAGMTFTAHASSDSDFKSWVQDVKQNAPQRLTLTSYSQLAKPSENNPPSYYASAQTGLDATIIMKYMTPTQTVTGAY